MKKIFTKRRITYFLISVLVLAISCYIVSMLKITGFLGILAIFAPYFIFDAIWTKFFKKKSS